jgi:hypothetical protein
MHWRRAIIVVVMAESLALVNSVVALFAAAATQIGRTKKKRGTLVPTLFLYIQEQQRQNKKNLKLKIALAV